MHSRCWPLLAARGSYCINCVVAVALAAMSLLCAAATPAQAEATDPSRAIAVAGAYGKLPLTFEINRGQAEPSVHFLARGVGYQMLLTADAAVIKLQAPRPEGSNDNHAGATGQSATLRVHFVGANPTPAMSGEAPLASRSNYFVGNDPERYVMDVPHYAQVRYAELFPGTDLVYYGNQQQLEFDFVLAPGADPARIKLAYEGADAITIDAAGNLVLRTALGDVVQHRPRIYQEVAGRQQAVAGRYVQVGEREIGLQVENYDASKPLVVDPVLSYSTYLGGSGYDFAVGIAVDANGNAYVVGYTYSTTTNNFPMVNAYDSSDGTNDWDLFVSKLNPSGTALVYSTYLGGSGGEETAAGIAIDSTGSAYVTGTTYAKRNNNFPVTTGAYQGAASGSQSFVTKIGAAGNTLAYSTFLQNTQATAIAVDAAGNAYITGTATAGFVTTAGAFQTALRSTEQFGYNAFVVKLNATGTAAAYATFLGSTTFDTGHGIAVDGTGNAYVVGETDSGDFPLANPFQSTFAPIYSHGFVSKLNPSGSALIFSTFLGSSGDDAALAVAVDGAGSAYVTGYTYSVDFPLRGAFQTTYAGAPTLSTLAFVTKFSPAGNTLVYSSYLGGGCGSNGSLCPNGSFNDADRGLAIAVDNTGHAYVAGTAGSEVFPLVDSLGSEPPHGGGGTFVAKIAANGGGLLYSTVIGAWLVTTNYANGAWGIAVDDSGAYVAGYVTQSNFPTTPGALQTINHGSPDGQNLDSFVYKLIASSPATSITSSGNPAATGQPVTLTATISGVGSTGTVSFLDGANVLGTPSVSNGVATLSLTLPVGIHKLTAVYRNGSAEADSALLFQVVNPPLVCN